MKLKCKLTFDLDNAVSGAFGFGINLSRRECKKKNIRDYCEILGKKVDYFGHQTANKKT